MGRFKTKPSSPHRAVSPLRRPVEAAEDHGMIIDTNSCRVILDDAEESLQAIFTWYCSYGERLNTDFMSNSKFMKFARDTALIDDRNIARADIDLIYKVVQSTRPSGDKHTKFDYDDFREAVGEIAAKKYQDCDRLSEALNYLLHSNIFAFASKTTEHKQVEVMDIPNVRDIFRDARKALHLIFGYYCTLNNPQATLTWNDVNRANLTMDSSEFFTFAKEFGLLGPVLSKPELLSIFRAANRGEVSDEFAAEMNYDEWIGALGNIAAGLAKKDRKPVAESLTELLCKMESSDGKKNLGSKIPGHSHATPSITKGIAKWLIKAPPQPSAAEVTEKYQNKATVEECEAELRRIFAHYSSFGEKTQIDSMGESSFYRLMRDCGMIDEKFSPVDVSLVYKKVTKTNTRSRINFDQFCEILKVASKRKYPQLDSNGCAAAFRIVLSQHILPFAERFQEDALGSNELNPIIKDAIIRSRRTMKEIFNYYRLLEAVPGQRTPSDVDNQNSKISVKELKQFTNDFDITPELVSTPELIRIFRAANYSDNSDVDADQLDFDEFEEVIGRIAVSGYTTHPSPAKQIGLLLQRMIDSDGFIKLQLQAGKSQSVTRFKDMRIVKDDMLASKINPEHKQKVLANKERAESNAVANDNKDDLTSIFVHYCSYGERTNIESLSAAKLKKMLRDCHVLDSTVTPALIDILCAKVTPKDGSRKLNYNQFVEVLTLVAKRKFGERAPNPMQTLIMTYIVPYADRTDLGEITNERTKTQLRAIVEYLRVYKKPFTTIFNFYSVVESLSGPIEWADISRANNTMSITEFDHFAQDFGLLPSFVSKADLTMVFRAANYGESADDSAKELNLEEFIESVGRIVLISLGKSGGWDHIETADRLLMKMEASKGKIKVEQSVGVVQGSSKSLSFTRIMRKHRGYAPNSPRSPSPKKPSDRDLGLRRKGSPSRSSSPSRSRSRSPPGSPWNNRGAGRKSTNSSSGVMSAMRTPNNPYLSPKPDTISLDDKNDSSRAFPLRYHVPTMSASPSSSLHNGSSQPLGTYHQASHSPASRTFLAESMTQQQRSRGPNYNNYSNSQDRTAASPSKSVLRVSPSYTSRSETSRVDVDEEAKMNSNPVIQKMEMQRVMLQREIRAIRDQVDADSHLSEDKLRLENEHREMSHLLSQAENAMATVSKESQQGTELIVNSKLMKSEHTVDQIRQQIEERKQQSHAIEKQNQLLAMEIERLKSQAEQASSTREETNSLKAKLEAEVEELQQLFVEAVNRSEQSFSKEEALSCSLTEFPESIEILNDRVEKNLKQVESEKKMRQDIERLAHELDKRKTALTSQLDLYYRSGGKSIPSSGGYQELPSDEHERQVILDRSEVAESLQQLSSNLSEGNRQLELEISTLRNMIAKQTGDNALWSNSRGNMSEFAANLSRQGVSLDRRGREVRSDGGSEMGTSPDRQVISRLEQLRREVDNEMSSLRQGR